MQCACLLFCNPSNINYCLCRYKRTSLLCEDRDWGHRADTNFCCLQDLAPRCGFCIVVAPLNTSARQSKTVCILNHQHTVLIIKNYDLDVLWFAFGQLSDLRLSEQGISCRLLFSFRHNAPPVHEDNPYQLYDD